MNGMLQGPHDIHHRGGPLDIQAGGRGVLGFLHTARTFYFFQHRMANYFFKATYNQTFFFCRYIKSNILFFITIHVITVWHGVTTDLHAILGVAN